MTGDLVSREDPEDGKDAHGDGGQMGMTFYKPRITKDHPESPEAQTKVWHPFSPITFRGSPADTLTSDIQSPELRENEFLQF
jgi:hypothetical protein